MDDPIRFTKLPPSTSIKDITASDNSETPAADPKPIKTGIASAKDSFEIKQSNPLFAENSPTQIQNIATFPNKAQGLLAETKSEISSYLKGEGGAVGGGEPFRSMMEYLKMAQGDAREDRKIQRASKELSMLSAESRLSKDNKAIDQQMKEAGEKADHAMNAAMTELWSGVAGGLFTIGGAASNLKEIASKATTELVQASSDPQIQKRSERLQLAINEMETEINKKENQSNDEVSQDSTAHRERIRDAILDFLGKISDMNPKI